MCAMNQERPCGSGADEQRNEARPAKPARISATVADQLVRSARKVYDGLRSLQS